MGRGMLDMEKLIDIRVGLDEVATAMEKLRKDKKNVFKAVLIP
jgi:threonine dehydrogenase-like Zn-dependent dehydrogenase